jgi:hypothetical protein
VSRRVLKQDLENIVNRINIITKSPLTSYTKSGTKYTANIGNYHLDGAYGGWALHRMHNESGSVQDILRCGYVSKSELQKLLFAYIAGLENYNE